MLIAQLKIISGGQTGADRAALDWAIAHGVPHGGWCPKGSKAEDGVIDAKYLLTETESAKYEVRTRRNVRESDATLILNLGELDGGSLETLHYAERESKPVRVVHLDDSPPDASIHELRFWLLKLNVHVLNVAGPRESKRPGMYQSGCAFLERVFSVERAVKYRISDLHRHLRRVGINQVEVAVGFSSLGQLLWKLEREISLVGRDPIPHREDPRIRVGEALNAAMTAWHLCDWTAFALRQKAGNKLFDDEHTKSLIKEISICARKNAKEKLLSGIQVLAVRACPELEMCKAIATRAKHRGSEHHSGSQAQLTYDTRWAQDDSGRDIDVGLDVWILDVEYRYLAHDLLTVVHRFWCDFLKNLHLTV